MSGAAHTPGPWKVVANGERFLSIQNAAGEEATFVTKTHWLGYEEKDGWKRERYEPRPQADADARLIAAAPDLLAALQIAVAEEGAFGPPPWIEQASAAIAKATGAA